MMKNELLEAMRSATERTRARQLAEATRVLQDALTLPGGRDVSVEPTLTVSQARAFAQSRRPLGAVVDLLRAAKGKVSALSPSKGRAPRRSDLVSRSYSCRTGARTYELFVPSGGSSEKPGLLLMLHGCTQDGADCAIGTRMNEFGEANDLLVVYPNQPRTANPSSCWNWFDPKDQGGGAGEPAILAGMTIELIAEFGVDTRKVFVAGLSAGGAMAAIMGESHPEIFSAVGVHSGLPTGEARNVASALELMRSGLGRSSATNGAGARVRTIVFHGDADKTVHPANAERIYRDQTRYGDAEVETAGVGGSRSWTRRVIRGEDDVARLEHWRIAGAGHAWSGGDPAGSYADPAGPDASAEMVRFFLEPFRSRP